MSRDLILFFDNEDNIKQYFRDTNKKVKYLEELNLNQNVRVRPYSYYSSEVPINASSEDGKLFSHFTNICKSLKYESNDQGIDSSTESLLWMIYHMRHNILQKTECRTLDELLRKLMTGDRELLNRLNGKLSGYANCGEHIGGLKIMYDGTIVNCQSLIFDTDANNIKPDKTKEYYTKKFIAEHGFYCNPLTDSQEAINNIQHVFNTLTNESFLYVFNQIVSLMKNLVEVHQISELYNNYYYLLKGALLLTPIHACFYNSLMTSGSLFNRESGFIRRYCNGLLDQVLVEDKV